MTRLAPLALAAPLAFALAACGDDTKVDDRIVETPEETPAVPVDLPEVPVETPTVDIDGDPDTPPTPETATPVEDPETAPDM